MIEINNLVKNYGKVRVLNIEHFTFLKGKSYLLVGSNGSGKSTLIKTILGINKISSGKVTLNTRNIGYVPEKCYYPEFLTIERFLKILLSLYSITNLDIIPYYCKKFQINKDLPLSKLSKGMMQKVLIIQALIHKANLFIFDEPLNGLDKQSQATFFKLIDELRNEDNTILITTHYQEFYQNKYDYYLKIKEGNLVYESNKTLS